MKNTSEVRGVHYSPAQKSWYARTPHKKVLFRGKDKLLAEKARLDYDAATKEMRHQADSYKKMDRFKHVWQPTWINNLVQAPILIDGFDEQ